LQRSGDCLIAVTVAEIDEGAEVLMSYVDVDSSGRWCECLL
jgi:hypothetical protein